MTDEMAMITICQEFGWTYNEYLDTPNWFLDLIKAKLQIDNKKLERKK